jgi:hypothetical protein
VIGWIKYQWRLRRLTRKRALFDSGYQRDLKAAIERRNKDEISDLKQGGSIEWCIQTAEIEALKSARLVTQANRFMLPIPAVNQPEEDGPWEFEPHFGYRYLTREAMHNLRRQIREEQHERRQAYSFWITGVVGVIGALTGLFSMLP